ncbi:MAG TPA: hypothetical protein VFG59_12035, partial [Anaeromyxobacter sp.]|nr:hypothetical protein [Anaeromyxobacter sp.]
PALAVDRGQVYALALDPNTGMSQLRRVAGSSSTPVANDTLTDPSDYNTSLVIQNGTAWSTYTYADFHTSVYGLSVMKLVMPFAGYL